ncbi:MAG TPA: M15 family metallopeptidase [Bacteroidia bacterium]|nr:M15 family metallopeptidase [Bacteroidia bacterium]
MKTFAVLFVTIGLVIFSCGPDVRKATIDSLPDTVAVLPLKMQALDTIEKSEIELRMESLGLVDILSLDSTFRVDLRYSSDQNFTGKDMYGQLNRCYLQKDVAEKLLVAQRELHKQFPYYSLLVFDGARPVSIQRLMWDSVHLSPGDRQKYLSNPENRSLHNYGAAVDLTIIDDQGRELDMGTPYDFFGELAHPRNEHENYTAGKLTAAQMINRALLRSVMRTAGFTTIETEWWHFNSCSRVRAAEIYPVIP